jgi:cell migration-inducing and hyaluronan-binding protein
VLALVSAATAQPCAPPYDGNRTFDLRIAPGEVASFPGGLDIPSGQRALVEGEASVTGGVTIRGTLFLSSSASSKISAEWIAVAAGGTLIAGSEACPIPGGVTATILLRDGASHPVAGRKALAVLANGALELHGSKGLGAPWVRLAETAAAGAASLVLDAPSLSSWSPGDEIAVASTDFDAYQTERVRITAVQGSRVQLAVPLRYKHFGAVTKGVDQRAEVCTRLTGWGGGCACLGWVLLSSGGFLAFV